MRKSKYNYLERRDEKIIRISRDFLKTKCNEVRNVSVKQDTDIMPGDKPLQKATVSALLFAMGRAIPAIALKDEDVKKEVDQWEDGFSVMFEILPDGPYLALEKKDGELHFLGMKKIKADLIISIKNIDSAFKMFTTQLSSHHAYAQHRMSVKGENDKAMQLIRILNIVQFLLFPGFISRKILKRQPEMTKRRWLIRLQTYLIAVPLGRSKLF